MSTPLTKINSDFLEKIIDEVETELRKYIYSKINKKIIESLDIIIIIETDKKFDISVEINLDAGPLTNKYQEIVEEATDLAHKLIENKIRG